MQLITTHLGADFDGLAAMLAARRLFPQAKLFFPGSREASVRRMLAARAIVLEEVRARDVDPEAVDRIVLCDTRQRGRLGVVAEWIDRHPGIEVVAFDHHPDSGEDIPARCGRVDPGVGALSTVMLEELRAAGLAPTAEEKEALLLGIYEDTGSLTHATTTARDLQAAGWLLAEGADLAAVRSFVTPRLDVEHLDVLHRMAAALEVHRPGGLRVGFVALELADHVEELAPLVSRCLELFELRLLVALFMDSNRITAIGRGDLPGFDLGALFRRVCGGGGHATAAAGAIRGRTLVEARELFLADLESSLPPGLLAGDLMLREFHFLAAGSTIAEAKQRLMEWRLNAAPVLDGEGRAQGVASRLGLDAAMQHGLGARPIEVVQDCEPEWVEEGTPVEQLARRLAGRGPRMLLVGDAAQRRLRGVVTRMMVLRALYGAGDDPTLAAQSAGRARRAGHEPVARLLDERLPPRLRALLREVAEESHAAGVPVFLVGGMVRDLLLGRENRDIDLVVIGDGPSFAARCAQRLGGAVRVHGAFLTATIVLADGESIDVATARSDFYRAPAVLPEVRTSPLRQDLFRRDFTVNTLAIRLGPEPLPELIDFFGGRRDLEDRVLRVLHSLSLIDDPTRAFRAVRLEQRLGFRIAPETLRLLRIARGEGALDLLSGSRLRHELLLTFDEPSTAVAAFDRWAELGLLRALGAAFDADGSAPRERELTQGMRDRLASAIAALDWYRLEGLEGHSAAPGRVLLAALAERLDDDGRRRFADRLSLDGSLRGLVLSAPRRQAIAERLREANRPSAAAALLDGLSTGELLLILASAPDDTRAWVRRELTEFRRLRLTIGGGDLLARGAPAGPHLGEALRLTRAARLDGMIGPEQELEFALRAASAVQDAKAAGGGA